MQEQQPVDFFRDPSAIKILDSIKSITQKLHKLVDDCKDCRQELRD